MNKDNNKKRYYSNDNNDKVSIKKLIRIELKIKKKNRKIQKNKKKLHLMGVKYFLVGATC